VAHALADGLAAAGVSRVYGLPGEDHLRLLDAFADVGLAYVAARDETAAAIMAATEAQATGRPGVVLVTLAPGLTNAINGIAHAYLDRVPLLLITGQHPPERAPLIVRQALDNHRLVDGLTKWSATASPRIYQVLARAIDTALAPPAGPVLLELRDDMASMPPLDAADHWPVLQSGDRTRQRATSRAGDPALREVRERLLRAVRPAMVVGGSPPDARTCAAIADFARRLRVPVFASPSALGCLPPTDPWLAGTFMNGNLEQHLLDDADLLLTINLDAKDFFNGPWRYRAPVLAINSAPDTQRFAPVELQVLGDVACLLADVVAEETGGGSTWSAADLENYRTWVRRALRVDDRLTFTIPTALRAAREILPAESLVAVDAGFGKPITSYLWSSPATNRYFTAHGLSTMGYALPAANALQLAFPRHTVVGFMGDGSLLMRASEIGVAAQHGIAPIYVAWMDQTLGQIEIKQARQGLRGVGTALPRTSCARVAEAFGGVGADVESIAEFRVALQKALAAKRPTLIGARVDQTRRPEWYELLRG
jgi:acetolactate synthase-1/2/3 large subunit